MEIPKFKLDVSEYVAKAKSDLTYYETHAIENYKGYVEKTLDRIIDSKPLFKDNKALADDLFRAYYKKICEKIENEIHTMYTEQLAELDSYFDLCLRGYETMSARDIESTLNQAKDNITKITEERFDTIKSYVSREFEDLLNQFTSDAKIKPELRTLMDVKDSFMYDLKDNIASVKREFVNASRDRLISTYSNSKTDLVNNKLAEPEKENSELKEVNKNDELMAQITTEQEKNQKGVTEADLGNTFVDFEVIQRYMNVFAPGMTLGVEGGYLVANDASGMPYVIQKKDDVISFKSQTEDKRYGLKIDPNDQSLSVKTYGEENLVTFETSTNTVTLAYSTEGGRREYEFHFENGNVLAFELNGEDKKSIENVDELIKELEGYGIRLELVLQISKDLSIEGEQRS